MLVTSLRIDDVNGLFAAFEAVFDERKQYAVLVVVAGEERADVTVRSEDRAPQPDQPAGLTRAATLCLTPCRAHVPNAGLPIARTPTLAHRELAPPTQRKYPPSSASLFVAFRIFDDCHHELVHEWAQRLVQAG